MRRKRDAARPRQPNRTSANTSGVARADKRKRRGERAACGLAYRAARLRLKVRLQVQGGVEIAAGVADAAALDGVHAHRDTAVVVRGHGRRRVREAALGLGALARAAQELPAHLHHNSASTSRERCGLPPAARLEPYAAIHFAIWKNYLTVIITRRRFYSFVFDRISLSY